MSALDRALTDYNGRLLSLRAWPDKRIIFEITDFCAHHVHIASHLADVLVSRLINPMTNIALKVPLFYLVDSLIKNVGGMYIDLFSAHIVIAFQRIFAEVNDTDKARLDFLLSTWEEGMIFHRDVLRQMRAFIGRRIVCVRHAPPRGPPARPTQLRDVGASVALQVRQEMEMLLGRMYADMGVRNPVPLDELSTTNPQLFFQIKRDAELNVQRWMADGHGPLRRDPFHPHSQLPHGQFESPRSLSIRAPRGMSPSDSASASPHTAAKDQIKAFIAETVVSINMNQAQLVSSSLVDWSDLAARPESVRDPRLLGLRSASLKVAKRLDGLLSTIHIAPQLPALLFDNSVRNINPPIPGPPVPGPPTLPLAPGLAPALSGERVKQRLVMPPFNVEELKRNPQKALRALIAERPFYSHQDGLRFKTQQAHKAHLDSLFIRNKEKKSREQSVSGGASTGPASRNSRQWYLDSMQWVTDCGALGTGGAGGSGASLSGRPDKGGPSSGAPVFDDDEEMVVPADENFPRCPVSNEVFEPIWDNEEGDFMYRNAVKVLLTEEADPKLYSKSQNTHQPGVRYALIHKRMALDGWLEIGKAISLKDAMLLRKSNPIGMADYAAAGNVDEDEDDVFVILSERDTESNSAGGSRMEVAESKVEEYDPFSAESKQ